MRIMLLKKKKTTAFCSGYQMKGLGIRLDFIAIHVLHQGARLVTERRDDDQINQISKVEGNFRGGLLAPFKVLREGGVFRHLPDVLPVLLLGEAHHIEDPIQLVVVVGVGRLNVLLTTVEDGLGSEEFSEDASNGPDILKVKRFR